MSISTTGTLVTALSASGTACVEPAAPTQPAKRVSKLTNQAHVKRAALELAKVHKFKKFTRVSQGFLDAIETEVRLIITRRVKAHPSVGKTLT